MNHGMPQHVFASNRTSPLEEILHCEYVLTKSLPECKIFLPILRQEIEPRNFTLNTVWNIMVISEYSASKIVTQNLPSFLFCDQNGRGI